ncbi:MAG: HAD family hydrolase [Actinomycetota bacterium]|nr:HAD family hydrolase [Actinomycetota bacterium]
MVAAVGFDLDGTLFDHAGAARSAIVSFLSSRDWTHPGDPGAAWLELEDVHFREYAAGSINFQEQRRRRMRGLLDSIDLESGAQDVDALFADYLDHYRSAWLPYPDVTATLSELRSMGMVLAVLTNGEQDQQEDKLRRMGVLDEFDAVLAASALPAFKPDKLAFESLCSTLHLPASAVVYVGDDLAADAIGARAAGLTPVWIDRHRRGGQPEDVPAMTSLTELPGHIRALARQLLGADPSVSFHRP